MLIVLTGPGSSGKDTVLEKLLEKYPDFKRVISTTTRTKRPNEEEGKDYYFVTRQQFDQMIRDGKLIEYVVFAENLYGTAKTELDPLLTGQKLIWRVETSRAANIKEVLPTNLDTKVLVIYIDVPNWHTLEERMRKRGMSEQMIQQRLKKDKEDYEKYGSQFENRILNEEGKLDETVAKITELIGH